MCVLSRKVYVCTTSKVKAFYNVVTWRRLSCVLSMQIRTKFTIYILPSEKIIKYKWQNISRPFKSFLVLHAHLWWISFNDMHVNLANIVCIYLFIFLVGVSLNNWTPKRCFSLHAIAGPSCDRSRIRLVSSLGSWQTVLNWVFCFCSQNTPPLNALKEFPSKLFLHAHYRHQEGPVSTTCACFPNKISLL